MVTTTLPLEQCNMNFSCSQMCFRIDHVVLEVMVAVPPVSRTVTRSAYGQNVLQHQRGRNPDGSQ